MRMLTLALLLASATSIPAFADPVEPDRGEARNSHPQPAVRERWQGGEARGAEPVNDEARAARLEAVVQARQARSQQQQPAMAPAEDRGRRGNWGGGQAAPSAPADRPSRNRGNWDGNRNWQGRGDSPATGTPPVIAQPRNEGWGGRNNRNDQGGGNWGNRRNGSQGQVPPVQNNQRRWDGDRNDGRHWDGNRNDGRHWDGNRDNNRNGAQSGGWRRGDNGRWERRGGDNRNDHDWNDNRRYDRNWNNNNNYGDWNRSWRSDRRYDWNRYRNQYRNHYRQPRYYNPYGYSYGYRRFGIGIYLDSLFFGRNYWLSDPWEYRLPSAPYGCRWVRYYDDVLLVDTRTGYVVDAIYGFFW